MKIVIWYFLCIFVQIWNCQTHQQNNLLFLTKIFFILHWLFYSSIRNTLNRYRNTALKKLNKISKYHNNYSLRILNWSRGPCAEKNQTVWKISPKFSVFLNQRFCTFLNTLKVLKSWHAKMTFTDCNKFKKKIAPFFKKLTICTVIQNTIFGPQYISVFAEHSVKISGFFCHSNSTWNKFGECRFANVVSRKIWVTEKLSLFHTVLKKTAQKSLKEPIK